MAESYGDCGPVGIQLRAIVEVSPKILQRHVGNRVNLAANCILETKGGSDYNTLSGNVLNNCGTGLCTGLSYIGTHDVAANNTALITGRSNRRCCRHKTRTLQVAH
jgi:hypothetical protein